MKFPAGMRMLGTDGWNSFWHFTFGVTGTASPLIFLAFLAYQLKDPSEVNILIDLAEFLIGYYVAVYSLRTSRE